MPQTADGSPCLIGARCGACAKVIFPPMPVCPACGRNGQMQEAEIGRTGRLFSHTIAHFAPKGFVAPFFQAFVDLPEGPRVFSLIGAGCRVETGVLEDGMPLRLVVEPVADTLENRDRLTYKFVPAASTASHERAA